MAVGPRLLSMQQEAPDGASSMAPPLRGKGARAIPSIERALAKIAAMTAKEKLLKEAQGNLSVQLTEELLKKNERR